VDYRAAAEESGRILRQAWDRFLSSSDDAARRALEEFRLGPAQAFWLSDWSLYAAAKRARKEAAWTAWEPALARREAAALARARGELAEEIAFEEFVQFLFFRQWGSLRAEAARRGIEILGDLPIYIAHDSADVWAHPELFALDADGLPEAVAGVPPDYFSATGQLWGYPVYRWDACAREGYRWWIERLRANLRLADAVRIDHFRGFAGFWEVPAEEKTALRGRWAPGPGRALFDAARAALGPLSLVAEDLGTITQDVSQLLQELGIPGMRVLQFAFSENDSPHLPHRHSENALVYTGTHDNDTTRGWAKGLSAEERGRLLDYTGGNGRDPAGDLLRLAYTSPARLAIVPLQDVFGLGSEARMNTPGLSTGNWAWRARAADFTPARAARLKRLAAVTGRVKAGDGRREPGTGNRESGIEMN
jgi:4-alpha-glucanotransferase